MPVRNGARWFADTLQSVFEQQFENIHVELSIYNDGSSASDAQRARREEESSN
jgi:glycosyltransferase involved in cell wall biosynthesis